MSACVCEGEHGSIVTLITEYISESLSLPPPRLPRLQKQGHYGWPVSHGLPRQQVPCSVLRHKNQPMKTEVTEVRTESATSDVRKKAASARELKSHHLPFALREQRPTPLAKNTGSRHSQQLTACQLVWERHQASEASLE